MVTILPSAPPFGSQILGAERAIIGAGPSPATGMSEDIRAKRGPHLPSLFMF